MRTLALAGCGGKEGGGRLRAGYTLLELSLSLVIVTTIAIGLGSAVVIASRAMPLDDSEASRAIAQAEALQRMLGEIGESEMIVERGATAIGLVLADRDGDGMGDLVRYAWDGNTGGPLTRSVNGGSAEVVVESLQRLRLSYERSRAGESLLGVEIDGSEFLLGSYESGGDSDDGDESTLAIDGDAGAGVSFLASLPAGATAWRVTRVQARMVESGSSTGEVLAQLERASSDWTPTGEALASRTVRESDLPNSVGWVEFALRSEALEPGDRVALTLLDSGVDRAGRVGYRAGAGARSGDAMIVHDGVGWAAAPDDALFFRAYGATITRGSDVLIERERVRGVRVEMDTGTAWRTRSLPLNEPEIVARRWDLSFDHDPTGLDRDRDGQSDWKASGGFDGASLSGGVWSATQTITSNPADDLTTVTTIDARVRDDTDNGDAGAMIGARVDSSAGHIASLELRVIRRSDGGQRVELRCADGVSSSRVLASTSVAHGDFIDLRLTVLPESDAVNLRVDGVDVGTFRYDRAALGVPGGVTLGAFGSDSGARFDSESIRVSPAP